MHPYSWLTSLNHSLISQPPSLTHSLTESFSHSLTDSACTENLQHDFLGLGVSMGCTFVFLSLETLMYEMGLGFIWYSSVEPLGIGFLVG